jgi:hypothetical protein
MDHVGVHDKCKPHHLDLTAQLHPPHESYWPLTREATGTTSSL